jgi:hypothetical protein
MVNLEAMSNPIDDHTPTKRRRRLSDSSLSSSTSPPVFISLKQWIEQQGGFVHESIRMDPQTRELYTIDYIPKGEIVFQIPNIIFPPLTKSSFPDESLWPGEIQLQDLYHPYTDVLLAWYLALKPTSIQPYIHSLPDDIDQALPRCWPEHDLDRLLRGSPAYQLAKEMKQGVHSDYNILIRQVQRETTTQTDNNHRQLPSFKDFSNAMAAITSRAFCGSGFLKGNNDETCMVPLLDLCNHNRGNNQKKNLSYRFEDRIDTNSAGSPLPVVVATAHSNIATGETLRITYGAQSNAQLLLNYGFCVTDNMEPDGSCNDVLQFEPGILLRTGPREYTYGPFVKALEFCRMMLLPGTDHTEDDTDPENSKDDLEQFLNDADELESTSDEIDYGVNYAACHDADGMGDCDKEHQRRREKMALSCMRNRLLTMAGTYALNRQVLARMFQSLQDSRDYFAAVLIQSELRTIQFFCLAINCIMEKLWNAETHVCPVDLVDLSPMDSTLMKHQIEDLLMAYTQIRYNNIP